jgi:predicted Zn-dependent protease
MGKLLEEIFRRAGRTYGTSKWIFKSYSSSEEEAIEAEHSLGKFLNKEICEQMEISADPISNKTVKDIGFTLVKRLTNQQRQFNFKILRSNELNGFALPGGFIFLTDRLVQLFENNRDEMAFVLGHEIGHVVKGHALDRMVASSAVKLITKLSPARGTVGKFAKSALAKVLYTTYSQDQEAEADYFGVGIMNAAHYNPQAALSFLNKLSENSPPLNDMEFNKYLSSHQRLDLRLKLVKRSIMELQK